jgi:hypothetical protein
MAGPGLRALGLVAAAGELPAGEELEAASGPGLGKPSPGGRCLSRAGAEAVCPGLLAVPAARCRELVPRGGSGLVLAVDRLRDYPRVGPRARPGEGVAICWPAVQPASARHKCRRDPEPLHFGTE